MDSSVVLKREKFMSEKDLEIELRKFEDQVNQIEKIYNPDQRNLHFENLNKADLTLFESLLSIGNGVRGIVKGKISRDIPYRFYDFFQLIARGSTTIWDEKNQKSISKDVVISLAVLLVELSELSTSNRLLGDIYKRNHEALVNLLLAFYCYPELRDIVRMKAIATSNPDVIKFIDWVFDTIKQYELKNPPTKS